MQTLDNFDQYSSASRLPPPKTADIFSFDDLLISCSHEIMVNGINSAVIPPTIKDWISGKIVQALPHRLIQKLLGFLIDNRDMTETIAYKEKNQGECPEFTLMLYRTAKAKIRHEKSNNLLKQETGDSKTDKPMFDDQNFVNGEGLKFFSDEIVVDQSTVIPLNKIPVLNQLLSSSKSSLNKKKLNKRGRPLKNFKGEDSSDDDSEEEIYEKVRRKLESADQKIDETDVSENPMLNTETDKNDPYSKHMIAQEVPDWIARPEGGRPKTFASKYGNYECHLCEEKYYKREYLYKHQKEEHPDFWEQKMANEKSWPGQTTKLVLSDEYPECTYLPDEKKYFCKLCGKKDPIAARMKKHVDIIHRNIKTVECPICGKKFGHKVQLTKHMCTHTGEYPFRCDICNKGFATRHKYREEHQKKHHYEDYIKWKAEFLAQKELKRKPQEKERAKARREKKKLENL